MVRTLRPVTAVVLGIALLRSSFCAGRADEPESPKRGAAAGADLYGDPLPAGAVGRLGTVRWRHGGPVTFVGFADKDKHLITACADGWFRVWDVAGGRELRRFGKGYDLGLGVGGILGAARFFSGQAGSSVALTPNGRTLASASTRLGPTAEGAEGVVHLWDIATGKERLLRPPKEKEAKGGSFGPMGLVFSPDSKTLATRSGNGTVRLWDVKSGKTTRQLGQPSKENAVNPFAFFGGDSVVFSPDGKSLALAGTELDAGQMLATTIHLYDVADGKERKQIKLEPNSIFGSRLAFSPDGKILALGSALYDAASGKLLRNLEKSSGGISMGGMSMSTPVFSPAGNILAVKDMSNPLQANSLRLWDPTRGKMLRQLGKGGGFRFPDLEFLKRNPPSMAFSRDGKLLADAGAGHTVRLWLVREGKELPHGDGHSEGITALAVAADGKTVASYAHDQTIRRWDRHSGKELRRFRAAWLGAGTGNVALSPDGSRAAGTFVNLVVIWDVAAGRVLRSLRVPSKQTSAGAFGDALALSPDNKRVAVRASDYAIHVLDAATGKELYQLSEELTKANTNTGLEFAVAFFNSASGNTAKVVFSADGAMLAAVGRPADSGNEFDALITPAKPGAAVNLWVPSQGKRPRRFEASHSGIRLLTFSPDGRLIVTANADDSISLWEILTGRECLRIETATAKKLAKAPAPVPDPLGLGIGPLPSIAGIAISPDGRTLAATGSDHGVRLWEMRTGKELGRLAGHQAPVLAVAFGPDNRTLISGAADTTALIWNVGNFAGNEATATLKLSPAQLKDLWADLASDPIKAYRAIHALTAAPKQAVVLLRERLRPAQGAAPEHIKKLVADLDSARFPVRQKAMKELEGLDELAQPALKEALVNRPSLEMRRRGQQLLDRISSGQITDAGILRALRSVQILEQIGTSEARNVLDGLARGTTAAKLTRHAQAALRQLPP